MGKGIQAQSNQWISRMLMVIQLSIASVLLTASVMVAMQSYQAVYRDLGYDIGNSYNISLSVTDDDYITQLNDFDAYKASETNQLLKDLSAMVENTVADSTVVVPDYGPISASLQVNAFSNSNNGGQRVVHQVRSLSATLFSSFNIPFLAGSNLTQTQIDNDENRVVIDANMAKLLYPNLSLQEVIGKTIAVSPNPETPPVIINGVVANTISQTGTSNPLTLPALYSHRIRIGGNVQLTVMMPQGKTLTEAMLADELKRQFPRLTNLQVTSLQEIWGIQTLNQRVSLWVVLTMTALTLF